MTLQEYKQTLYEACAERINAASIAADRYASATTAKEREQAKIENKEHLAAHYALQWALYKISKVKGEEV